MATVGSNSQNERMCWKCGKVFPDTLEECPDDKSRLIDVSQDDRKDPMVGSLFDGRFRIYKKLGEGGMGHVYSARQIDFERDVALKILKLDFIRDENIRKRFMYEARTISNLRHPNAIRLFDFGQAPDGSFYMVMELLEGESLADRLAYKFLTYGEIFNIVPPVCGVLDEAHQNDVIHRDLKPENIYLVDVNGREEFSKLLDFGIAKHLSDRTMTKSGTLWGTPAYMSPEQAKGDRVDGSADIYAIGIMLYELICGNLPFSSTTQMGLALKHISVPARPLLSIPGLKSVPQELDDLILSCLSKDPKERPKSMADLADQLDAIAKHHFDDDKMAWVPAEEVDAIALRDWMQEEPSVDDELANAPPHLLSLEVERTPETLADPPPKNLDLSDDEINVTKRPYGIITLAVIALAGCVFIVTYFVNSELFVEEARTATSPELGLAIEEGIAERRAPANISDAAGVAVTVLLHAQMIASSVDEKSDDFVVAESSPKKKGRKIKRPTRPKTKSEPVEKQNVKEIKSELEKTF